MRVGSQDHVIEHQKRGWGRSDKRRICRIMDFQRAICVVVDDSRRIVHGLDSGTTAEDVISVLQELCNKQKPQVGTFDNILADSS